MRDVPALYLKHEAHRKGNQLGVPGETVQARVDEAGVESEAANRFVGSDEFLV